MFGGFIFLLSQGHTDVLEVLLNRNADNIDAVDKVIYIMRMIVVYSNLQHLVNR